MSELVVIGGGLAGCEAAWQAAEQGIAVTLFEMRPQKSTGAHTTADLAELVCSNSLGSALPDRASGVLKTEMARMGSLLLECAQATLLPAGGALAVDRTAFSQLVTQKIHAHPNITVVREEMTSIPAAPTVLASGPLTSEKLAQAIRQWTGAEYLSFFDAISPIVTTESINMEVAFYASRYPGTESDGDYINCPFTQAEYERFVAALCTAEQIQLRDFEADIHNGVRAGMSQFFEGCLPVEIIARREPRALSFGPMRPVGLKDPRTGTRPYAVVQLRQDNLSGSLYNIVGFQTNLTYPEQRRIFRLIPGLENAAFARYGQMHRNTFIASPRVLEPTLQARQRPDLFFAGQITGVEGYMGNIATGLLAGLNAARWLQGKTPLALPPTTMLGALCHYITHADLKDFQPMKANFGLLPELEVRIPSKKQRFVAYAQRAIQDLSLYLQQNDVPIHPSRETE